jgi:hypothetical protein
MPSVRQTATAVAAGAVGLAVAVVAVSSAVDAFTRAERNTLETQLVAKLTQASLDPRYPPPASIPDRLRNPVAVLSRQPLDNGALARAALQASIAGQAAVAQSLMTELLHRDPRSRPARLWLMNAALEAGDLDAAAGQLGRLLALNPQMQEQYFPILADIARRRGGERPMAALLARNPPWREQFLGYLTTRNVGRDLIFRLTASPTAAASAGGGGAQAALLQSLVDRGDYDGAYLAWINFLPEGALSKVAPVYDGGFAGLPGPQPFNWSFNDGQAASVGIEAGQGLQIDYGGTQTVRMASQTLLLKPGKYRFDYVAHGSGGGGVDSGSVAWHIQCLPGGAGVLDLPVADLTDRPAAHGDRFAVPAGCNAQLLSLEGTAGTFSASRSIWFTRASVTGVD